MNTIGCSPIGLINVSFWFFAEKPKVAATFSLSKALKKVRKVRGLTQESFSDVSSRTYLSSLERDLKKPTIGKLAELCDVMNVHPLTLITIAFAGEDPEEVKRLLKTVDAEINAILNETEQGNHG